MAINVNKNYPTEAELARLSSSELEIYELENESQVGAGEVLWGEIKTRFLKQESDTNLESAVDNYEQVQARSILVYSSIETRQISDTEYEELPRISKSLWANFSFFSVIALVLMVSMFMVPMALSDRIEAEFSLMAIGMTVVVLLIYRNGSYRQNRPYARYPIWKTLRSTVFHGSGSKGQASAYAWSNHVTHRKLSLQIYPLY